MGSGKAVNFWKGQLNLLKNSENDLDEEIQKQRNWRSGNKTFEGNVIDALEELLGSDQYFESSSTLFTFMPLYQVGGAYLPYFDSEIISFSGWATIRMK